MLASIVRDFQAGVVDPEKIRKVQTDPFRYLHLADAVGVRPSVLRYRLPIDDERLRNMARDVRRSRDAGRRIGVDWMPRDARVVEKKEESDDHWVTNEQLRPLNDVCTKWCTRVYFPDAFARVNMVANVIRLYDRLRDVSGLRFNIVFKGGVMIRLVLLEFLNDLPLEARLRITEHLQKHRALSISDFDFEIVPDNHKSADDEIHRFFLLDYAVLLWLQRRMQQEVERGKSCMMSLEWSEEDERRTLQDALQAEVNTLPSDSPLYRARIDHVVLGDTASKPPTGYRTRSGRTSPAPRRNALYLRLRRHQVRHAGEPAFGSLGCTGCRPRRGGIGSTPR